MYVVGVGEVLALPEPTQARPLKSIPGPTKQPILSSLQKLSLHAFTDSLISDHDCKCTAHVALPIPSLLSSLAPQHITVTALISKILKGTETACAAGPHKQQCKITMQNKRVSVLECMLTCTARGSRGSRCRGRGCSWSAASC